MQQTILSVHNACLVINEIKYLLKGETIKMKKKLTKTLALGLSLAAALTLTTGCGKKKDAGNDTIATTESSNADASEAPASSSELGYKDCPWVFSRGLSDAETLELPEGAGLYGLIFPVTTDTLFSMPYSAASVPLTDALDESAYSVSFYEDSYSLPQLMIDEDDMTIGEALDKNLWSLFSTYLDYDAFGVSEDAYNDVYNSYDDPDPAYIYMDMLTTMFGTPNYICFGNDYDAEKSAEENTQYFVDTFLHPEKSDDQFSSYLMYIGWQFEDFGIAVDFFDTLRYSETSGYSVSPENELGFTYVPIEKGTLEDYFLDTFDGRYGTNIVKELMAEKTALFGDVEYLTADEKIVELVNSAKGNASATDAETTESTTDSSNYVDVDRDFSEAANDVYMAITDCFQLGGEDTLVLNGTTNKGVFKTGDPVYVQLTNGKVVEGTISRMEQLRQDVTESTLGESIGIMVDGLSISDQDYVTGGVIVVK